MSNREVITIMKESRTPLNIILQRKRNWMEQLIREKGILMTVFEGAVVGTRKIGRKRLKMVDGIKRGEYEMTMGWT